MSANAAWEAFRRVLEAYQHSPHPEAVPELYARHVAFVRAFCPEGAEAEIAAFAKRLEGGDIAA